MAANPRKPMDKANSNEINLCKLSVFHAIVRKKLFPDKAISQSENRETYRKSISFLDTSVLDTSNAEKLIQYMHIKRGYNIRPRVLLNSCSPEKAKRVWPIEIETLIEGGAKRKENTTSKNKADAEEHNSTQKLNLGKDYQPVVPLRRISKRLLSKSSINESSNNTRKDQLSFHPVIASTPNQGKSAADDLISNTSKISCNATSCGTIPESGNQARILSEAETTDISKANGPPLNKKKNAPKNTIFVQDNVSENNDNNIEEINAQEQDLHSNRNDHSCDDDDDTEQTLANLSKTLINNETTNTKKNKTRNGVTSLEQHLRVELKRVKAKNLSLRKELVQRNIAMKRYSIATSARKTNELKKISFSSPADNNKSKPSTTSNNTVHREISTTTVNYNLEPNQQIETDEAIHRVNKTVNEFRKDYGQAPFVVIPIHQSFHNPASYEKSIKTSEHKETEVLERSQKQRAKKQPDKSDKSRKSSSRNTLNTSSDLIHLPSVDDILTDDEDTPQTSSAPLDLRLNLCKPSEHTETYTKSKTTNRSSIKNLNPSDILVDDIIYYSQKQRNHQQLHSTISPKRRTQTRLNERQESDINTSLRVPSPALVIEDLDESGSERIVDDIFPSKEPDWHKTLSQTSNKSNEKSVVAKRRGRSKKPKVSTIVTPYLELSKKVNRRKRRTQSSVKRKLYSKGRSDEEISSSGSNSFDRENMLSGSSTNTLKNKEIKAHEKSEKITKVESKRNSSYAERKDEIEALPRVTEDDNDDDIFVRPSNPVTRSKHNKKTKNTTTQDDDHPEGSQSAKQTVSETNKKEQAKEKKILKQSKNINRKNNNAANIKNNIEIPLEPISVEPELQDWLGNEITTSDNFVDNSKKPKQRRRGRSKSNLKENNERVDPVNQNTNIDSDNSGSNTITKQTRIEKKSANDDEEYSEQGEKRQNNATNANKSKAQSKAKARNGKRNNNRNQEFDALLLEDDSTHNGLRRSKRTHRPPIQYWTNTGEVQKIIDLKDIEVKKLLKPKKLRVQQKKKNIQSQQLGMEKKQIDDGDKTVCDLFDQLKENLEETLRKRKESPRVSEKTNKKRLKLTANHEKDTEIRKLSGEIMPPPPAPPPQRKKPIKPPAQDNSTLNSTEKSLACYIRSNNAHAAASSDDGIGTADENIGMSTLAAESVDTVHSSQKRQEKDGTKDFLLDWLVNNSPPYLQQNRDVFKLLSSDKIKIACIENLVINEINGVEYANYTGKDNNYGYMKFYPNSQKPKSKTKNKEMKLLILVGKLAISLDEKCFNVKNGDFVTIPQGTRYVINNNTDQCSILFFIKP